MYLPNPIHASVSANPYRLTACPMDDINAGLFIALPYQLSRRLVPAVEVHHFAQRSPTHRAMLAFGPAHHDMSGDHPVVGHADGVPQQLLAAIGAPTRQRPAPARDPQTTNSASPARSTRREEAQKLSQNASARTEPR